MSIYTSKSFTIYKQGQCSCFQVGYHQSTKSDGRPGPARRRESRKKRRAVLPRLTSKRPRMTQPRVIGIQTAGNMTTIRHFVFRNYIVRNPTEYLRQWRAGLSEGNRGCDHGVPPQKIWCLSFSCLLLLPQTVLRICLGINSNSTSRSSTTASPFERGQ